MTVTSNILFSINDKFWYSEFKMPLNLQQASHIPDFLSFRLPRRRKGGIQNCGVNEVTNFGKKYTKYEHYRIC